MIIFLHVLFLQKQSKRDLNLTGNMDPSSVVENRLQLPHNARDHDEIIRAYIDTILGKFFLHSNYYIFQLAIIKITNYSDKTFSTLVNIFTILGVAFLYTFIMTNSVL